MTTLVRLLSLLHFICYCDCHLLTGGRLGDFPPSRTVRLHVTSASATFYEVAHECKNLPFLVNVYAYSKTEGDDRSYRFVGTGSCQNDGQESQGYGGILYAYNEEFVRIWIPSHYGRDNTGRSIFVGEGWGGNTHSQSSSEAFIVIEIWENGPFPSFQKHLSFYTRSLSTISLKHPLQMIPEFISVRVTAANKANGNFYHFHATSSSQTTTKTLDNKSRRYGGIIFAYNDKNIVLWGPNKKNGGCTAVGKRWGDGKESNAMFAQNCTIEIRLWVNSFSLPVFQSEWRLLKANQHTNSFVEIPHDLRTYPSYVRVQYRKSDNVSEYIFEGIGSVQATPANSKKYGGILCAYNNKKIRLWLPTSSTPGQAFAIFVGNGWGEDEYSSESAQVRVLLYVDGCKGDDQIVDAMGVCRKNSETHIEQRLSRWGKCSNPCGNGTKLRTVDECKGRSLKTRVSCNFEKDFCGFQQSGPFKWRRTKGVSGSKHKELKIPYDGFPAGSYFVYSDTARMKENYARGYLISPEIKDGGENCLLTFHYNSVAYFGSLNVHVMKKNGEWVNKDQNYPQWAMKDSQVMSGLWRKGYINFGEIVDGPIRQFKFEQELLAFETDGDEQRNPISLANIELRCEESDLVTLSRDDCKQKEMSLSSCNINVFKPYAKGPAWNVNTTLNRDSANVGKFVVADGEADDLIATYQFKVLVSAKYAVWVDSFSMSNKSNGVTVSINEEHRHSQDLIFNRVSGMWLPLGTFYLLQAGTHKISFYQWEKGFRFRNLMIAPKKIKVWGSLGMQTQFIPDSGLSSLTGSYHTLVYSRLNGEAAWMPTDETKGRFYLEIMLPELALINKIATQGGTWLDTIDAYPCSTDKYKMKFSLDGENFAYYRINTLVEKEHEFEGNKGVNLSTINWIKEHTLEYTIVARAVRFYPTVFEFSGCMRVELYGYFLSDGLCPKVVSQERETTCTGNGQCAVKNMKCQSNQATNISSCECVFGYHGNYCNMTGCKENLCLNGGTCRLSSDRDNFFCECSAGYRGKYCELLCFAGTYGDKCEKHCDCSDKKLCNPITGSCLCEAGFHGDHCTLKCSNGTYGNACSGKCACPTFMECNSKTGECSCQSGYYGNNCSLTCATGTFGRNCTQRCSCQNGGICDGVTGKCSCTMGWFGKKCQEKCPPDRWGENCGQLCHHPKNSTCDHSTGHWTCNPGLHGTHCEEECNERWYGLGCHSRCACNEENTKSCGKKTGACHCKAGYEGQRCEEKCSGDRWGMACLNKCKCKHGGECDHITGQCTCAHGYRGVTCELECEKHRYGKNCGQVCNCTRSNTHKCEPTDGRCLCLPGYKGEKCEFICSDKTWGRNCRETCGCKNGASCDHKTGFCDCQPGFQGLYCELQCGNDMWGLHCAKKCTCMNNARCDSITGACTCQPGFTGPKCQSACDPGWYGKDCLEKCTCVEERMESCNNANGQCSCLAGFHGTSCEEDCVDNTWGKNCDNACSPCRHANGACEKRYGNCSCSAGFVGYKCNEDCPADRFGDRCGDKCTCDDQLQLCNNINGNCYDRESHVISVNFLRDPVDFRKHEYLFREQFEILLSQCFDKFRVELATYPDRNVTDIPKCVPHSSEESGHFIVRVVSVESLYTSSDDSVSAVTLTVLNNSLPVTSAYLRDVFTFIGSDGLTKALEVEYYAGDVFTTRQNKAWYEGNMKWIAISLGVFGIIILAVLVRTVVKCTKKVSQPSPFQKIKTDAKDNVELQPCISSASAHLLAFENPYYDVIAAMGLDDDVEEDYYNPLYEMPSDSETENEELYFAYRNHRSHYPYDKDSGFSSGTLM